MVELKAAGLEHIGHRRILIKNLERVTGKKVTPAWEEEMEKAGVDLHEIRSKLDKDTVNKMEFHFKRKYDDKVKEKEKFWSDRIRKEKNKLKGEWAQFETFKRNINEEREKAEKAAEDAKREQFKAEFAPQLEQWKTTRCRNDIRYMFIYLHDIFPHFNPKNLFAVSSHTRDSKLIRKMWLKSARVISPDRHTNSALDIKVRAK